MNVVNVVNVGMPSLGKFFIFAGFILVAVGLLIGVLPKLPWLGRLPGDILIRRGNFAFAFPIVTCLILSFLLTLVLHLFFRR